MSDSNGAEFRQNTDSYTYPDAEAVGYLDPTEDAYEENLQTAISCWRALATSLTTTAC